MAEVLIDIGSYQFSRYDPNENCGGIYGLRKIAVSDPSDIVKSYGRVLHQALSSIFRERCLTSGQIKELIRDEASIVKPILEQEPLLSTYFSKEELGKLSLTWIAVLGGYQDAAELLVRSGADVNELFGSHARQVADEKWTILHVLVQMDPTLENERLVRLITDSGADLHARDSWGRTALHFAVDQDRVQLTAMLLEKGADVNVADKEGNTPLLIAAYRSRSAEMLPLLVKRGADITARTSLGNALHHLTYNPNLVDLTHPAKVLIENGVSLDVKAGSCEHQPIHRAVCRGKPDLLKLLLDNGANVNAQTKDGKSPLYFAAEKSNKPVLAEILLEHGANVDLRTIEGRTALHNACLCLIDNEKIIGLLLSAGANVHIENRGGITPFACMPSYKIYIPGMRLMLKALALQKVRQPLIKPKDEKIIKKHPELREYYQDCIAHILRMKFTRFIGSCTFFELLTKSPCQIAALMRNPDFEDNFGLYDLDGFFMYAADVRRAFVVAQNHYHSVLELQKVIDEAAHYILPYTAVRKVVSYLFPCCVHLQ